MPPRPVHPGKVLKQEIEFRGLSANRLAIELRVPTNRITRILNEQFGITADTAIRLSRYLGGNAEFWLRLQTMYELRRAQRESAEDVRRITPAASTALRDTYKYEFKQGNRILHRGITNDLDRREVEHQRALSSSGHIRQVGQRTTVEAARNWEMDQGDSRTRRSRNRTA